MLTTLLIVLASRFVRVKHLWSSSFNDVINMNPHFQLHYVDAFVTWQDTGSFVDNGSYLRFRKEYVCDRILIIIIIIIIISFMQGIYTYIPETNCVPREYGVAAILFLLFMVLISLVSVFNLLYFYISTFRSMCAVPNMAAFCSSLNYYYYYYYYYYHHHHHHHFLYAGYLYLYSWDKLCPKGNSVAAILLLLFMVLISLVLVLNLLYFYITAFRSMSAVPNMAVFCSSLNYYYYYYYYSLLRRALTIIYHKQALFLWHIV